MFSYHFKRPVSQEKVSSLVYSVSKSCATPRHDKQGVVTRLVSQVVLLTSVFWDKDPSLGCETEYVIVT